VRLADALEEALGSPVADLRPIAGGDLNDAFAAEFAGGTKVFVKTAADAAPHAYKREAEGLRWLAEPGGLAVPEVLAVADEPGAPRFLALAWVEAGRRTASTDEELGRGLAAVHAAGAPAHGGAHGLVVGPLTLPNEACDDWPSFYVTRRLDPLARMAAERGALPPRLWPNSTRSSPGCLSSPARPSRPPACTATCGAATCWSAPTAGPG